MKTSIKLTFSILCILLILNNKAQAQKEQFKLAEKYYNSCEYYSAITEFERFIYFNQNSDSISNAYFKIAYCYRAEHKWDEAIKVLKDVISTSNDSIGFYARLQIGLIYLASNQLESAEYELIRTSTFCNYKSISQQATFFLGVCNVYKAQWQNANENFKNYYLNINKRETYKLDSLIAIACQIRYKSPEKAKWLSTFVPGLGQIYGKDYKSAVNSLLINTLNVYLILYSIAGNNIWDLILIDLTFFERYYMGGRDRAEEIVKKYNLNLNKEIQSKILDELVLQNSLNQQ